MSTGEGVESIPPSGFLSITQKREKISSSNFVTFFIDKWVTVCTIKLEDRPFHVAMVMTQIKGVQNDILKKNIFFNSDVRNGSSYHQLVTLPNFAKFHPQTTEIQPFKVECFLTKTLKFQNNDVIIFDVSGDFGIFFGMWNRLVMSYLCAKFCCDSTLITRNAFSCTFFCIFLQMDGGFSIMTSLSMTSLSL